MKDNNVKRKILKDRNFPNSDQINKHQNFDRINKDYSMIKKIMLKKTMIWSAGIIGVAVVAGFVFLNKSGDSQLKSKIESVSESLKTVACIQPPIPGQEKPFAVYRVSSKDGGMIHYPTGSSITIPPNAFVNKKGKPLSDSIDIKYREFHDPLEIFLSGIPMKYDSAGISNTLESAGMIEILAFDKGDDLSLNEKTPIQIKMASANNEERFNLYELDTVAKNWVYKGKDKIVKLDENKPAQSKKEVKEKESGNQTENIIKPVMADPQKYCFKIGYDPNEFPELAAYENVQFEVTDNSFKPAYFKINWKKISLYSSDEEGQYIVKLKKADTAISVTAKPVFDKADYSKALAKFKERHNDASKERDQKEFEKQASLNKVNKDLKGYNTNNMMTAANNMSKAIYNGGFQATAYRQFSISSIGFHNCDFPIPPIVQFVYMIKKNADKKASDDSRKLSYSTIFLVEKGKNTVFKFSKGEPVRCNPQAKNLMWTMTDKNELAFFRIADYNKLVNGAENNITPVPAKDKETAFEEIKKFSE